MNLQGQPAYVGRHCGSNRYEITKEVVAFYEDALDDRNALHAESAPPLLHHSECYQFVGEWYLQNLFGNLHGQQDWELFAPIRVGSTVVTRSTIIDRYHKRGRDWVVNETDLCDAEDGRLLVRGRTYQSFLPPKPKQGEGGFVVDEKTAGAKEKKAPHPPFPTATGADLATVTKTIDERRCWMFSGPGRNYHTDVEQARKLGFPNIVVQGMMSTCFVSQVMQDQFGMGWLRGGKMSVKLTNVLWVNETVSAHAKVRDEAPEGAATRVHCDVWVEKTDGTRVILGTASALREPVHLSEEA
ncbi:MAG: MaoC family dehydratase N-terminal domain-containing protein [Proteobacteria bacterium]|nr:MaoC family dehydratase N-terminal domain-containing protein [Pseudomonadota bacterium]